MTRCPGPPPVEAPRCTRVDRKHNTAEAVIPGKPIAKLEAKAQDPLSTRCAARSVIRRPPQLGRKPRPLHENATNRSVPQSVQRERAKPCASTPHGRIAETRASRTRGRHARAHVERARRGRSEDARGRRGDDPNVVGGAGQPHHGWRCGASRVGFPCHLRHGARRRFREARQPGSGREVASRASWVSSAVVNGRRVREVPSRFLR